MTNADKYFRNATDEELSETIMRYVDCGQCLVEHHGNLCTKTYIECKDSWLDWLKQEVESDA